MEQYFEAQAGLRAYHDSFLLHYLDAIVYPNLPDWAVTSAGTAVCALNLGIYCWRFGKAWVQERRHVEIPNENTGERYGVSRNSAVFVAECRAAAPRHQPFDRFTIQLGNPEQDRGAGFLEPAFDGQKLAVSNADRDLSVAGAEDAVLGDGGGYAFGWGYVECGVADGAANGNITGIRLILQRRLPWSRGADRRHPGSSAVPRIGRA